MSYATPQDIIDRYPNRDLVQLTNEDPTATAVDTAVLQRALDDAGAEIDSYLQGRFALPLSAVPVVLGRIATDIAIYRLQVLRPLHDLTEARKRYDDALAVLRSVAAGELTLGPSAGGAEPSRSGGEQAGEGPVRIFSRRKLRGY